MLPERPVNFRVVEHGLHVATREGPPLLALPPLCFGHRRLHSLRPTLHIHVVVGKCVDRRPPFVRQHPVQAERVPERNVRLTEQHESLVRRVLKSLRQQVTCRFHEGMVAPSGDHARYVSGVLDPSRPKQLVGVQLFAQMQVQAEQVLRTTAAGNLRRPNVPRHSIPAAFVAQLESQVLRWQDPRRPLQPGFPHLMVNHPALGEKQESNFGGGKKRSAGVRRRAHHAHVKLIGGHGHRAPKEKTTAEDAEHDQNPQANHRTFYVSPSSPLA
mmetsp:Transcript_1658/g.5535  ORF Transcript_1658/g.5535 Transcript_1658/m.5535 type:complete len:271 (+) Transcript_1658:1438-2250(+)